MNHMQLERVVEELITNVDVCKIVNDNAEKALAARAYTQTVSKRKRKYLQRRRKSQRRMQLMQIAVQVVSFAIIAYMCMRGII